MSNLRDYYNKVTNDGRIFSLKDVMDIPAEEDAHYKDALDYQAGKIGFPTDSELSSSDDVVYVHSYSRDDGTKVRAHYRSKNGHSFSDPNRKPLGTPTEAKADLDARIDKWMDNKIEGTPTGGAAGVDLKGPFLDKEDPLYDSFLDGEGALERQKSLAIYFDKPIGAKKHIPLTLEYYKIALTNGDSIKESDKNNLKLQVKDKKNSIELMNHLLQLDSNITPNTMLIEAQEESKLSSAIKDNSVVREALLNNIKAIISGKLKNSTIHNINFYESGDLASVLGTAHIYNPCYEDNGDLVFSVIDWYDFAPTKRRTQIEKITDNAYRQQEAGMLTNYVLISKIRLSKDEILQLLVNGKYIK